jgi:hypothetical protein
MDMGVHYYKRGPRSRYDSLLSSPDSVITPKCSSRSIFLDSLLLTFLPDPRVVTIEVVRKIPKDYRISCQDRVPSTLLVNRESREVCLPRYTVCFEIFENVHGSPVYFDFSRDIICLQKCVNAWWEDINEDFNKDLGLAKSVMIDSSRCSFNEAVHRVTPFHSIRSLGMAKEIFEPQLSL